ncbi:hypothetical protein L861_17545 [Litchfieldella anticariensis FP35 = DSM 16096]|uniref:Uncharacterized protein n=2 Tax=Litchfieldella anticariensis TaxID=258591 RepID=S2KMK5_LITA3|nr:hypothetical protein [Halomonas anticariensis]EPC03347.1 hypothetical protein L861_17545 [Halomonas anticariensis FP35 = DSM 16096]
MSTVFETVVAGVSVYVLGQIIIKFIIEPILEFRSLLGRVTQFFLRNQGEIITAKGSESTQDELFVLASELLQKRQSIIWYSRLSFLYGLPSSAKVLDAAKNMNQIGNRIRNGNEQRADEQVIIYRAMQNIERCLSINVSYNN